MFQSINSGAHGLQQLWLMGLVAMWHVESSQPKDRTQVPCIGRCILNHWTTREVPHLTLNGLLCCISFINYSFVVVVQSLGHVLLFVSPWTAAHQASLSFTISQNLLKFMSIELVMPSNHFILCHRLLFLPLIFPSIRVFSNELALHIRWPKSLLCPQ